VGVEVGLESASPALYWLGAATDTERIVLYARGDTRQRVGAPLIGWLLTSLNADVAYMLFTTELPTSVAGRSRQLRTSFNVAI
jgi:hypothetical protein